MTTPIVDIVCPTFNQSAMTLALAKSLKRNTAPGSVRMIWVDNGSDVVESEVMRAGWIQAGFDLLPMILPTNLGFVKATNAGIAVSTAPYVLLLNNDCEVPPGWLEKLIEVMEQSPMVGIVGPLSSSKDQWQGNAPAAPGWRLLGSNAMLAFFCALLRREVLVGCGYLSEEYKAGLGDDDDYCERVKLAKWMLALRTDLVVTHHHRTTFRAVHGEGGWLPYQEANIKHFKEKWNIK